MKRSVPKPRPFVKWAGGKRQIVSHLISRIPKEFGTYYEPFLGGGALLFEILPERAVVGDVNEELINAYLVIRDRVEELISDLKKHRNERDYYYRIRSLDPKSLDPVRRASRFIYLNKTCYNGLWRVNSRGMFNVPFGRYKNPKICDEENLRAVSEYLRSSDVRIVLGDYRETLKTAGEGDFVYLDPPYAPVSETSRFTEYVSGGFSEEDQIKLAEVFRDLDRRGCYVMLSNSDTPLVKELYRDYLIEVVEANRFINRVANRRRGYRELIIRNYEEVKASVREVYQGP